MTHDEMLSALGNIDGHGEPCQAYELIRLNSFEANAMAERLRLLQAVVEAARNLDLAQTAHFDVTRGPGRQWVYEIDEERVKDLERAPATLDTNLPQFTGSGKNVSKEKV